MSSSRVSYFDLEDDSVVPGPVSPTPFDANAGNLFPKYPDLLSVTALELWFFDGLSGDGNTAFTTSFFRDARGIKNGGWGLQVLAMWPDGSTWRDEFHFCESVVTADGGPLDGSVQDRVEGVWRNHDNNSSASFTAEPQLAAVTIRFNIKQRVEGTVVLKALDGNRQGLPSSEAAAILCPDTYYMRPISLADARVDLVFHDVEMSNGSTDVVRDFKFVSGRGGMDRCWTPWSWAQLLSESYYLRANVGPYDMQVMRTITPEAYGRKLHATARLWKNRKLVCAAQRVTDLRDLTGGALNEDVIAIEKVHAPESPIRL
ncbi:hypothetical protein NEMBOFW57_006757 [Staphylotrichum longicolle]|uniref:Uncharacterized protein n=1 Tax=Staphylotrichum longicolle TaxID=669026 RepID=A0AAD4HYD0_9PEZI|nr:hypothetical protein NEMBOFW57_006757 [Staphylotrichum longicolle]